MTDDGLIRFRVHGKPRPGGSKRGFAVRKAGQLTGRVAVADTNPRVNDWKGLVIAAAIDAVNGHPDLPLRGPLAVEITFLLARPKGHYGTGRGVSTLRPSAPTYPTVRPDVSKLARPTIDALTNLIWVDDALIVDETHRKRYETPEGAYITVREIGAT